MNIFCLIPALNEKGNLKRLTSDLVNVLTRCVSDYKIFYVVQGSDGSLQLLKKLKLKYKNLDFIYYPQPLGIGRAYKIGFKNADSSFTHILTLDADLNHDPKLIPELINEMNKKRADIVVGSRFVKGGGFRDKRQWKKFISFFMNKLVISITGIKIHDISSGFRLIRKDVIDNVADGLTETGYPNYMELAIRSNKKNYVLSEVPIIYKSRIWGKSKMAVFATLYDYLLFLFKLPFIS